MGRNSGSWKKGQSGNPSGKRPNALGRAALRKALGQPGASGGTLADEWAAAMVAQAVSLEDRLAVWKFLEGANPPQNMNDDHDAPQPMRPRIMIPGSGVG